MPALGGSARRIAEGGNFPSWSPDGSTIIYESGPWGNPKVLSVPASGGAPREIPITLKASEPPLVFLFYPSYSSDGRRIVFEANQETIYVVSAAGGDAQRIAKGKRPAWNADSSAIIYSKAEPGRNFSLWQVPVSLAEGKTAGSAEPLTISHGRDTQPAVSRDGKLIAFAAEDVSFISRRFPSMPKLAVYWARHSPSPAGITSATFSVFHRMGSQWSMKLLEARQFTSGKSIAVQTQCS